MTRTLWQNLLILVACTLFFSGHTQGLASYNSLATSTIKPLASFLDSLKKYNADQGYKLVKEAPLSMLSDVEMAVLLPLEKDKWYRFIFIGDNLAEGNEIRLYDHSNRQVLFQKNHWEENGLHITQCNLRARESDYHLMKPTQISQWKKKLHAYLLLLEKK